jgi:hypothetical protein
VKNVPTLDMFFESAEDALAFYVRYAWLIGFDVRRNRTRNNGHAQEVQCKAGGQYKGGPELDRTCGKTTKKKKCKAMVCIARSAKLPKGKNKIAMSDEFCLIHDYLSKMIETHRMT